MLNRLQSKLFQNARGDFKYRQFDAVMIVQAVSWYLRYALSYRDIEELYRERGISVCYSTLNRWVLYYAPLLEKRLRQFRKLHCGSVRIDETYIKVKGQWKYLYRAIDKQGTVIDFLLTAQRDAEAAKRFFRKAFRNDHLFAPSSIGTDGASVFPQTLETMVDEGILPKKHKHHVTKILQQGIESDHFRLKKNIPKNGCFQTFQTARRTLKGYEAMLWLKKGFGWIGEWTVKEQNNLLGDIFALNSVNRI